MSMINNAETSKYSVPDDSCKQIRKFSLSDQIFAWLCLFAGYAFCRIFPVSSNPLGGILFILSLFCITAVVLKLNGSKFSFMLIATAISALLISSSLIFCSNAFLCSLAYLYALVTYCYFVYSANGNSIKKGFCNYILIDYFKALFILPFDSFEQLFKALFSGKIKKGSKFILKLFLGIIIAIIPTVTVMLLLSYDSSFNGLLNKIFDFNLDSAFSHIGSLILGIPIGMYLFGLFVSSSDNKCKKVLTEEQCLDFSYKIKIAPSVTVIAATIPLLLIYVIFFISQWQYYISGFTGALPKHFSYAEYAREGFFQLCMVSVINLLIILSAGIFMRCKLKYQSVLFKILCIVYSVFTLILISTAVAKMIMYIDCYGLTQKRVYATWMMIVLAVVFILIIIYQFVPKLNLIALSLVLCIVFFAVLSLSNADGMIARYNVSRYIQGSLETVDIAAMEDLGDAAIPEIVRLAEVLDEKDHKTPEDNELFYEITEKLDYESERFKTEDRSLFSFNLPSLKAEQAIEIWNVRDK